MTDVSVSSQAAALFSSVASRRSFLKTAAATAIAGGALGACSESSPQKGVQRAEDASGGTMAPNPAPVSTSAAAGEMDRMHEAGVKAFPAKTEKMGNQIMKPRIEKGIKIFDITAEKIQWETEPAKKVEAHGMFGMVTALIVET